MNTVSTIGIDLAKNIFHLHAVDQSGKKIYAKKLRRAYIAAFITNEPKCTIAMEACSTAHYWGRLFSSFGHEVLLINPTFVKAYVKSNKNDYNDAEAICEASSRPSMRFVPIKTVEQQDLLALHNSRELVMRQRTQMSNHIRSQLAERGLITKKGISYLKVLANDVLAPDDERISLELKQSLSQMMALLKGLEVQMKTFDKKLLQLSRQLEPCKRLLKIGGIGPIGATALYAKIGQGFDFKNGREASAWAGLVPRQYTTGGKPYLLGVGKRGDKYLRKTLVQGAKAVLHRIPNLPQKRRKWLEKLQRSKHQNVIAVALANKNMRIAWAMLKSGEDYQPERQHKAV